MFDLLSATCTVKMCLTCRLSSVFPRTFWPFISPFSLLFPFLHFLSLFNWRSRVFLFFKLSFSVLRSLVSSSCYSLFFCSSMVDYSFVWVDCPSISFLFAHLGCLLEIVEGECLKGVSLFMGEDYLYRFVFSSLFRFASCSAKVARSLKMSGEVRSSELERGYLCLIIARFLRLLPLLLPIKLGTSNVPSQRKMRSESGIGFNFLIRLELGFRVTRIGPVTHMLMKYVSMK